ncbi:putative hydro-lyase [Colletotrichum sp. SAR 10_76]|nr:putative hydro-lyase [Colletotrichum sp. SAR 10_76]
MTAVYKTGEDHRLACRSGVFETTTAGQAPTHLQANLIVLPKRYADDFRLLCHRNPVPCPLLAESESPGDFSKLKSYVQSIDGKSLLPVAKNVDLRHDAPRYRVYENSKHVSINGALEPVNVADQWTDGDHVGFLIGCSFSFERALHEAGLTPQHMTHNRNVPMYRTNIPLCAAGVFTGATYVVSMRPYKVSDVEKVRDITRPFVATHGEPVAWGWDGAARIGVTDVTKPQWGDPAVKADGKTLFGHDDEEYVPVFWGCGVTPQEAVMKANLNADDHPEATVIGVDLSPIQPGYVSPNCSFEVDDVEKEWTWTTPFDFIFIRAMIASFKSWPDMISKAYANLEPGGYLEIHDNDFPLKCDDGTMTDECKTLKWTKLLIEGTDLMGRPITVARDFKKMLEDAGFVDVVVKKEKWPYTPWPKDPKYKELGEWDKESALQGIEAITMALFTRVLDWSVPETTVFCAEVRNELKRVDIHAYYDVYSVYGRKPEKEASQAPENNPE